MDSKVKAFRQQIICRVSNKNREGNIIQANGLSGLLPATHRQSIFKCAIKQTPEFPPFLVLCGTVLSDCSTSKNNLDVGTSPLIKEALIKNKIKSLSMECYHVVERKRAASPFFTSIFCKVGTVTWHRVTRSPHCWKGVTRRQRVDVQEKHLSTFLLLEQRQENIWAYLTKRLDQHLCGFVDVLLDSVRKFLVLKCIISRNSNASQKVW